MIVSRDRKLCLLLVSAACFSSFGCSRRLSYQIDISIAPSVKQLPGLDGGPTRTVAAIADAKGSRSEFVQDEVTIRTSDKARLQAFLAKYHGVILRDGTPPVIPGLQPRGTPQSSGDYLIHVDLAASPLDDMASNMKKAGVGGSFKFSSEKGARLAALVAREKSLRVSPNYLLHPYQAILEGPNPLGADASKWPWMSAAPAGLGIGVIQAWNYLRYKGLPPVSGTWRPAIVAIIDAGFDLDANGKPNNNNTDYLFLGVRPLQFDLINHSGSAGGQNPGNCGGPCPWHGQQVFSIAAAMPRNQFGTAGTGGDVVFPLLIKIDYTSEMAGDALRAAAFHGASVANMSFGGECSNAFCRAFDFGWTDDLQGSINIADSWGTVTVAAAGNGNEGDNNQFDNVPCTLNNVVCVGAIGPNPPALSEFYSGSGQRVAIWAPDCIWSTPVQPNLTQLPSFCGTSAASPFVAGIVAMLKVLQPSMYATQVSALLRKTARSSGDPRVSPGYVDAFQAVQALSPNQPPTIQIVEPTTTQVPWGKVHFASHINDPEQPGSLSGISIVWSSDRDGVLCSGLDCTGTLSTVGSHSITATVTDPFGASGKSTLALQAIDVPPKVTIFNPANGTTFAAGSQVNLTGFATSPSQQFQDIDLRWSSSLTGPLPAGHSVLTTLPAGMHTITLKVTDQKGGVGQTSISLNLVAGLDIPTIKILSPVPDPLNNVASAGTNQVIQFQASVTDPVDGVLRGNSVVWTSNIDGFLGTGTSLQKKLSGGPCGAPLHTVTVKATNAAGKSTTQVVLISVGGIC